jgi:hypothetical protein
VSFLHRVVSVFNLLEVYHTNFTHGVVAPKTYEPIAGQYYLINAPRFIDLLQITRTERRGSHFVEQGKQPVPFCGLGRVERCPSTFMQNYFVGSHRREVLAVFQTLLHLTQAYAATRFDVVMASREFTLILGIVGLPQMFKIGQDFEFLFRWELVDLRLDFGKNHDASKMDCFLSLGKQQERN